jgi:hypothetical protein
MQNILKHTNIPFNNYIGIIINAKTLLFNNHSGTIYNAKQGNIAV